MQAKGTCEPVLGQITIANEPDDKNYDNTYLHEIYLKCSLRKRMYRA